MNGTGDGTDNKGEIKVIIRTIATLAFVCVVAICTMSYLKIEIPPELNTLTGGLVASLTAMLVKTTPTASTPTETKIVNPPEDPVPTKPEPKP